MPVQGKNTMIKLARCFLIFLLLGCLVFTISSCTQQTNFKFDISIGNAPLLVTFINSSSDADEYLWDFGDGTTATSSTRDEPVTHEYTKAGIYSVALTSIDKETQTSQTTNKVDIIEIKHGSLHHVNLVEGQVEIAAGTTQQLSAVAVDAYDNLISDVPLTWKSEETAGIISVDVKLTAGTNAGYYENALSITAEHEMQSVESTFPIIVIHGPLDHITLEQKSLQVAAGQSVQLGAHVFDVYENKISEAELTWKITDGAGTINNDGMLTAATKTGNHPDSITVTAELNGNSAVDHGTVKITPGAISRTEITPGNTAVTYGQSVSFRASAFDAYGNVILNPQLSWEVIDDKGTISQNGIFTADLAPNPMPTTIMVTATYSGHSVTSKATVTVGLWRMVYLGMNTKVMPYQDKRIQRAVSYCIDSDEIISWARREISENVRPVHSIIDPDEQKNKIGPIYDLEKADQLLAEAGYPDGFMPTRFYVSPGLMELAEMIAANLDELWMNTTIISINDYDLNKLQVEDKKWGDWGYLFLTDTQVDWYNAPELLGRLFSSDGEENFTYYSNVTFDRLFDSGSFDEAEFFYFDNNKAVIPLYWNIPLSSGQKMFLDIFNPQVNNLHVTVNGVTETWATRIHWDWGDGTAEDAWFPASHNYLTSGTYTITVTVYGTSGSTVTDTVAVTVG
ncbi:MAG TPA: PKD domain-containing protein [Dehalococcoidia bacterium]|nr:PKD domain-containing protein [Dehalococcoidia bacterium]